MRTGVDLIRSVRCSARTRDIPIIVYSAVSETPYIDEAMNAGATDYWLKGAIHGNDFGRRLQPYLPGGTGWADPWPGEHLQA
jgi:PleD family two-component response regulator